MFLLQIKMPFSKILKHWCRYFQKTFFTQIKMVNIKTNNSSGYHAGDEISRSSDRECSSHKFKGSIIILNK